MSKLYKLCSIVKVKNKIVMSYFKFYDKLMNLQENQVG